MNRAVRTAEKVVAGEVLQIDGIQIVVAVGVVTDDATQLAVRVLGEREQGDRLAVFEANRAVLELAGEAEAGGGTEVFRAHE